MLGTGLSILGWPLQVIALLLAPLVVVQPALAAGLLVLVFVGQRMLGEHAGRHEHIAMAAIVIGVIGAGLCAPPRSTGHTSERLTILLVLVVLAAASLLPYLLRTFRRSPASVTIVCAGFAFGWSGVATKLASDDLSHGYFGVAIAWGLSTAAASAVGVLSESSSLQSRPAIQVAPVVFVTQTIVPVALAPALFGERFSDTPLGGVPLGALAGAAGDRCCGARAFAATARADGRRAGQPCQRLDSQPVLAELRDDPLQSRHRGGGPVERDDQHFAGAHGTLRQGAPRVQAHRPAHRFGAGRAREHELSDGQPAAGLQEVEAVTQVQRAGLGTQRAARPDPAQQRTRFSRSPAAVHRRARAPWQSSRTGARCLRRRTRHGCRAPPAWTRRAPPRARARARSHQRRAERS